MFDYESPITQMMSEISNQMVKEREDKLLYEIRQTLGYNIDKNELVRALQYDRNQYQKGYEDARREFENVVTIDDKKYKAVKPIHKTTAYDGECVIGGFWEIKE